VSELDLHMAFLSELKELRRRASSASRDSRPAMTC
jgi:hypothetical protein